MPTLGQRVRSHLALLVLINSSPVCLFQGHFSAGTRREDVGSGELHPPHQPMGLAPTRKLQEGCGCPGCVSQLQLRCVPPPTWVSLG